MPTQLITTATDLLNGVDAYAGIGSIWAFTFANTWAAGDTYTVTFSQTLTGTSLQIGAGTVTGLQPSFVFTYNDKVNLLAGTAWYFSDVGQPTVFNDPQALGNSFIELSNSFGTPENLTAIATYQGRLIITSRRTAQIWSVDPDPVNYQKGQLLQNIGTMAPRSVQTVGDADVYMLADNGIRSIRVRDASNNAITIDVGTPIDTIIQGLLNGMTETYKAQACGCIEPSSNRYWLYMYGGHIYVYSAFPTSEIAAWSRYRPTYNTLTAVAPGVQTETNNYTVVPGLTYKWTRAVGEGIHEIALTCGSTTLTDTGYFVATAAAVTVTFNNSAAVGTLELLTVNGFIPTQFAVQKGRVYARAGDKLLLYGGLNNISYDYCLPQYDMPFLNAKSPATRKTYSGMDHVAEGIWTVSLGTDVTNPESVTPVLVCDGPSVMKGRALSAKQGTHFKIRGVESSDGYARFSNAILHYEGNDPK